MRSLSAKTSHRSLLGGPQSSRGHASLCPLTEGVPSEETKVRQPPHCKPPCGRNCSAPAPALVCSAGLESVCQAEPPAVSPTHAPSALSDSTFMGDPWEMEEVRDFERLETKCLLDSTWLWDLV